MTYKALNIAKWFLLKDVDKTLFNKKLTSKNGITFYEGNAHLNKFLLLAQNMALMNAFMRMITEPLWKMLKLTMLFYYSNKRTKKSCNTQ